MLFIENVAVYSYANTKPRNTLCVQNAELINVKTGATVGAGLAQSV
jgi:hypothetical protein